MAEGDYKRWYDSHQQEIVEHYRESIDSADDVPDSFVQIMWQDYDEEKDR